MKKPDQGAEMRPQRGFTILELMIVITVLAIVVGIGVPGMRELVLNNRQASAVNELVTALQMARSEAITRNIGAPASVSICTSSNGTSCGGGWADGWIVFSDANGDGAINGGDEVIRATDAPQGLDITAPGLATAVRYRRDGRSLVATDFVFCDSRGAARARVVQLGLSGRPAVSKKRTGGADPSCD